MRGMGNMGNMQGMMQKMQKMQKEMQKAQEKLNQTEFTGESQSGLVTVKMTGEYEVKEVTVKPEAVDPEEIELLQDLIVMATQDCINKIKKTNDDTMGKFTKGMSLPGL